MPETCAAIVIAAKHGELIKVRDYSGITDTVGALRCKFEFRTNDWDNATMTAVFCKGNMVTNPEIVDGAIGVLLDSIDECAVPAEVLTRDAKYFSVGVWGVTTAGFRIVSKWLVFRIEDGCYVDATDPIEPTPTLFEQIMATLASKAPIEHEHNDTYYTKSEIDEIVITGRPSGSVVVKETDPTVPSWAKQPNKPKYTASEVGALPNTTKIPSATSDLTNNSGYITKDVSNLANYHKKSEVYTKTEIDNKGFLTQHQDLSSYAKKTELPTKTSQLENNSGFITLADLPENGIAEETDPTVPNWAKQPEKPKYDALEIEYINTSLYNQTGTVKAALDEAITFVTTEFPEISEKVDNIKVPTKVGDLDNDRGFITLDDLPENGIAEEIDPTVPSWAKQSNKPEYNASEIEYVNANLHDQTGTVKAALDESIGFVVSELPELAAKKHIHNNASVLNNLGESDGKLTYNGEVIKGDPYALTEADKNTIVEAVKEALPKYNGEVIEV